MNCHIRNEFRLIQTGWADQVNSWESCSGNKTTCPDMYVHSTKADPVFEVYKYVHIH